MVDLQDMDVAVVALALLRSGKLGASAVRDLLLSLYGGLNQPVTAGALLDSARVTTLEINGSLASSKNDIARGAAANTYAVPFGSSYYPPSLAEITDAPPILFVRGNLEALLNVPGVAVVGTRKATANGLTIATRIATFLSNNGWAVISGLALGIDAAAHEGALLGTTATIAVLAHGLERASPRANEPLGLRILERGGAWVSEHPYGTTARPQYFVQRNRIQVGLSAASVIVEGELHSGSMTQAEYCLRYRRELFAVVPTPGTVTSIQSELPRMLVSQRGAHAITSRDQYPLLDSVARKKRLNLPGWSRAA
jgi:DNA processing protein